MIDKKNNSKANGMVGFSMMEITKFSTDVSSEEHIVRIPHVDLKSRSLCGPVGALGTSVGLLARVGAQMASQDAIRGKGL